MTCPRCRGFCEERLEYLTEGRLIVAVCVNCGWRDRGMAVTPYVGPERALEPVGRWAGHRKHG